MTKDFLVEQCSRWPGLEPQDLLKALYQSVFGCGHFVGEGGEGRLLAELGDLTSDLPDWGVEPLDGPYCRFHLRHLAAAGLRPETLYRLFFLSAQAPRGTEEALEEKLLALLEAAQAGGLPWTYEKVAAAVKAWREQGFPSVQHSQALLQLCRPAYRVLRKEFIWMLPLLAAIDRLLETQGGGIVAIDGCSAAGKSTLARCLQRLYDCEVYHMDDFFLRPEQRTERRLQEAGGNVDRERFMEQVLLPVSRGEPVSLRRYDCKTDTLSAPEEHAPKALTIVEGAYAAHPALAWRYDLAAYVHLDENTQRERILRRNGEEEQRLFFERWIPLEKAYFEGTRIEKRCDLSLEAGEVAQEREEAEAPVEEGRQSR